MCDKCQKKSCTGCSNNNSVEQLANQLAELQDVIDTIQENAKFLLCGHPILLITYAKDIEQFNLESGEGTGCWEGWAICNGESHYSKIEKKNITTPNFTDRFIVQAGGDYEVGDTGGLNEVILTTNQIPSHNHNINDPGHVHQITDPGHIHPIQDDMHVHQIIAAPHRHEATLDMGTHSHDVNDSYQDDANIGFAVTPPNVPGPTQGFLNSSTPGEVTVASANETSITKTTDGGTGGTATGFTDETAVDVTSDPAATGIEVLNALTGITETDSETTGVTTLNTGRDEAHENRPPFFAALYIMKL